MYPELLLVGGDERQRILARRFSADTTVHTLHVPGLPDTAQERGYPVVILPCPAQRPRGSVYGSGDMALSDLRPYLAERTLVFGGALGAWAGELRPHCAGVCDVLTEETTVTENARLTAEAAVLLTQSITKSSLFGAKILVLGYGRIGKNLTRLLAAYGARVTVLARREAVRAEAACLGYSTLPPGRIRERYDLVFNTIPASVVTKAELSVLGGDCPWVELASEPCGLAEADRAAVRYCPAGSLPGRLLPESAAEILYRGIRRQLKGGQTV